MRLARVVAAAGCAFALMAQAQAQAQAAPADSREALLQTAEQALARGDTPTAAQVFERAALLQDAADTEMGQVRTMMQAGAYRHALAFCAHIASEHLDVPAAGALYAWLLRAGGQKAAARRVLDEALQRAPDAPVVRAAQRAFAVPARPIDAVLLAPPHRLAPEAILPPGQVVAAEARIVSSGVLFDGGRRALVPIAAVEGARRWWVRDGLGRTTEATVDEVPPALRTLGIAALRLSAPLLGGAATLAPRDPFAGSIGHAVEYEATTGGAPAWPALHQGFFGGFEGRDGLRKLGIELGAGPRGGPVFDAAGRLAGIALPGREGRDVLLTASMLRPLWHDALPPAVDRGPAQRMPADEAYERALRVALQVLAQP